MRSPRTALGPAAPGHVARPLRLTVTGGAFRRRPGLRADVEQRLTSTLGQLVDSVEGVSVLVTPVTAGPQPGACRCEIVARLVDGRDVAGESVKRDLYAAMDGAAEAVVRDIEYLQFRFPSGGGSGPRLTEPAKGG